MLFIKWEKSETWLVQSLDFKLPIHDSKPLTIMILIKNKKDSSRIKHIGTPEEIFKCLQAVWVLSLSTSQTREEFTVKLFKEKKSDIIIHGFFYNTGG